MTTLRLPCALLVASIAVILCLALAYFAAPYTRPVSQWVAQIERDLEFTAEAIAAYTDMHGVCPVASEPIEAYVPDQALSTETQQLCLQYTVVPYSLTTPIACLSPYLWDPYGLSLRPTNSYMYWSDGRDWLLLSPGPSGDIDTTVVLIAPELARRDQFSPSSPYLLNCTYDPSNGTRSPGNIWMAGSSLR